MKKAENIIVGISIGDLNGIGSEVILKTFEDSRMLEMCTPVIFGNVKIMSFIKKMLNSEANFHGIDRLDQMVLGKINVLNVWRDVVDINFGQNDENIGKYTIKSFVAATNALKEGTIDVLVTAPINKYNIQSEDFKFPGHTDYLDQELDGNALMFMVHDHLRVGLLTSHSSKRCSQTTNRSIDFQKNRNHQTFINTRFQYQQTQNCSFGTESACW